jgi:hypothetical protein
LNSNLYFLPNNGGKVNELNYSLIRGFKAKKAGKPTRQKTKFAFHNLRSAGLRPLQLVPSLNFARHGI